MLKRRRTPRARLLTSVGLALYAVVLLTLPFEHHDLVCHLKTPQHCTSCASSVVGSDPATPGAAGAAHLTDAGGTTSELLLHDGFLVVVGTTGRSPPARSSASSQV